MSKHEELEYYISADYINNELVNKGLVYRNQPDLRPVKSGVFGKILNTKVLNPYTRKEYESLNDTRLIPVVGKLLLINETQDTIYLVDEYNSNQNNKVSIPGGHLGPNDIYANHISNKLPLGYLYAEINREIYEELRFGYQYYEALDKFDKSDIFKCLNELGIKVIKEFPFHYLYIDNKNINYSSFAFYLPLVVNMDSCNYISSIVPYSKDDHSYLKEILKSKGGVKLAVKEFDMAKKDIRIGAKELIKAIFNTSHLIL